MPYLVESQNADRTVWEGRRSAVVTRPPVDRDVFATAENVRKYASVLGADYGAQAHLDCVLVDESHIPIALPNGTTLRVRFVTWRELYEIVFGMAATRYHFAHNAGYPRMIAAYREMHTYRDAARARAESRDMNIDEQRADRARRLQLRGI